MIDGVRLREGSGQRWIDEGEGSVVMPLHGIFGAPANFQSLLTSLRARCRVVVPLLPLDTLAPGQADLAGVARIVDRLVDQLSLERLNLVGNSLGGQVALLYALDHPARVRTLTLTGSAGLGERLPGPRDLWEGFRPSRLNRALVARVVAETFHDPAMATPAMIDEVYATLNCNEKMVPIVRLAKSSRRETFESRLSRIPQPACIIWGRNDAITPPAIAEAFASGLPRADLFWLDDCGHAPMLEQPEAFNRTLLAWYEAQGVVPETA